MSRPLVEWLLANPVQLPDVPDVGDDRAWRVLINLADFADEDTHLVYCSDRTIEKRTGLNRRGVVQKVFAALQNTTDENIARLERTGKRRTKGVIEYVLHIPGYIPSGVAGLATKDVENMPSDVVSGVVSGVAGLAETEQNIYPPNPPKKSKTELRQHGQGKLGNDSLLEKCIERDLAKNPTTPGRVLQKQLHHDYSQWLATARDLFPKGKDHDLVTWCCLKRNRETVSYELLKELDPDRYNCETCKGRTVVPGESYRDENDNWVNPGNVPCPECQSQNVTHIDTHKRVNTETRTNTYLPGGTAQADTQSVSDIARRITAI